jgi:RHS repeat-associated protein
VRAARGAAPRTT